MKELFLVLIITLTLPFWLLGLICAVPIHMFRIGLRDINRGFKKLGYNIKDSYE